MASKKKPSFEEAMARLDDIVDRLDSADTTLEESLALFTEGAELIKLCDKSLGDARLKIEKLFPSGERTGVEDGTV